MKYIYSTIVAFALCVSLQAQFTVDPPSVSVTNVQAQGNPPLPTDTPSFFATAQQYFTSFNTNLDNTFIERGEIAVGVVSIQGGGVNLANEVRGSYVAYKALSIDAAFRDAGIAGTFVSEQLGLSANYVVHDAKFTVYMDGLYHQEKPTAGNSRLTGELGIRVQKALTQHTFAGVEAAVQFSKGQPRVFGTFAGFTF